MSLFKFIFLQNEISAGIELVEINFDNKKTFSKIIVCEGKGALMMISQTEKR